MLFLYIYIDICNIESHDIDMKVNTRRCSQTESLKILIVNFMINNESSSISFERSGSDNEKQGLSRRCGMGTCYRVYAHIIGVATEKSWSVHESLVPSTSLCINIYNISKVFLKRAKYNLTVRDAIFISKNISAELNNIYYLKIKISHNLRNRILEIYRNIFDVARDWKSVIIMHSIFNTNALFRQFTSWITRKIHLDPNHNFQRNRSWHSNKFSRSQSAALTSSFVMEINFQNRRRSTQRRGKSYRLIADDFYAVSRSLFSLVWTAFHARVRTRSRENLEHARPRADGM